MIRGGNHNHNKPSVHQLPQRNNTTFKSWTNNNHSTNSEISEDYEDIEWKPISSHQKTRKPINGSAHKPLRKTSRIQDWVNFNIKSLGDSANGHDSDSGFDQPSSRNEYHSMYIEPWSNCHDNSSYEEDKVRIFVSGPSPEMARKFKHHHSGIEDKPVKKKSTSYKSKGPNDERFYVSEKPSLTSAANGNPNGGANIAFGIVQKNHSGQNAIKKRSKKQYCAPQPPARRSIGLQTEETGLINNHIITATVNHNMSGKISNNTNSNSINKKTYLFATSSNEMAFPNSMPPAMTMMSTRKIENYNNKQISSNNGSGADPQIPDPDYSPILIRKISKKKKEHRRKTNLEIWGNAARYKGSLEELDQELGLDDTNHGNAAKVKDLVEKLKSQTEKDRRKRQQRIEKKDFVSLRPTPYAGEDSNNSRMSSRRSSSEERDGQNADSYISDNFSTLSVSTSNISNHFTNRMSQYSPSSWGGNTITSSRSNASSLNVANQNNNSLDEPVSMIPCNHEQNVLQDVKSKQSQFFNSLFPSRANRFGFPVYPERSFGIPSQMNVPVSFAGFSPEPNGTQSMLLPANYNDAHHEDKGESSSILSDLPKMLMGRRKKYSMKKKQGIFGLF